MINADLPVADDYEACFMWGAIMRSILAAVAAVCAIAGFAGESAARTKLYSSGNWTLYRQNDFMIAMGRGEHVAIEGTCVAETGNSKAKLAFVVLPPVMNADKGEMSGVVFGQVQANGWHFRSHTATVVLERDLFTMTVGDSLYDVDMIMFNLGGHGHPPVEISAFAQAGGNTIKVLDMNGNDLASFSGSGLGKVYPKLLECGGIR
jgi:hypothetical protein